jgi:two-component sensor histidine kinase
VAVAASIITVAALGTLTATQYDQSLLKAETTSENTARLLEEYALRTFDSVTELVNNALKHAFPDGRTGTIRVDMDSRRLVVRDDGVGTASRMEVGGGFGMQITQALVNQIGAQMDVDSSDGRTVIVSLPQGNGASGIPTRSSPSISASARARSRSTEPT